MESEEIVQKTVRIPKALADEVDEVLRWEGYEEMDFAKFARRAVRNELRRLRDERAEVDRSSNMVTLPRVLPVSPA